MAPEALPFPITGEVRHELGPALALVAARLRMLQSGRPICAGLAQEDLILLCDFCLSGGTQTPATCVGCGVDVGEVLAACDACCGHSAGLDDGGPCIPVTAGVTQLDWSSLHRAAVAAIEALP